MNLVYEHQFLIKATREVYFTLKFGHFNNINTDLFPFTFHIHYNALHLFWQNIKHVFFHMSYLLPGRMQSHTDCICLAFLHCAFSNVSSDRLPEKMHSHIGCIFLHCVFSNVFSKRLHERMQSHTDCICLTSPHCALSNVSSSRLYERMHNHTGCICWTFLQCVSCVSPNYLAEMMHSHSGCIC